MIILPSAHMQESADVGSVVLRMEGEGHQALIEIAEFFFVLQNFFFAFSLCGLFHL